MKDLNKKLNRQQHDRGRIYGGYSTIHEVRFINKLGTFKSENQKHPIFLLQQYIKSCKFRTNWEKINKEEVIKAAKARLHLLSQGMNI